MVNTTFQDLQEKWPEVFADENQEDVEDILLEASLVELIGLGLRVGFEYTITADDLLRAARDAANVVGTFVPDAVKVSCLSMSKEIVVIYIEMEWECDD